jgi:hypothetical protein
MRWNKVSGLARVQNFHQSGQFLETLGDDESHGELFRHGMILRHVRTN